MGSLVFVCPITEEEVSTGLRWTLRRLRAYALNRCVARTACSFIN